MAKKSASELKAKKQGFQTKELPPIEETFEKIKHVFTTTLEVNVQIAKRIDNMLNLRDLAYKMLGEDYMWALEEEQRIELYKWMQDVSVEHYQKMLDIAKEWTIGQFTEEDMPDWFDELIPKPDKIESEMDLLMASIIFLTVKPYGERMAMMHQQMLDEMEMRKEA